MISDRTFAERLLNAVGERLRSRRAAAWIRTQDVSPDFHAVLDRVVAYVEAHV